MSYRYRSALLLITVAGCTRTVPTPEPAPRPADSTQPLSSTSPIIGPGSRWRITSSIEPQEYSSIVNTTLELDSASARIHDTVTVHTRFTLSLKRLPTSVTISGSIEAFSIAAGNRVGAPTQLIVLPLSFSGQVNARGLTLKRVAGQTSGQTTDCVNPGITAISTVQRNLVIVPEELQRGASWTDSSSTTGCSGSIPVIVTSIRTYSILGETEYAGDSAIALKKTDRTYFNGEGAQDQHRIIVKGEGSGSGVLYVTRSTGMMIDYESKHNTVVTITSSGQNQRFIQIVKEKTVAVRQAVSVY